MKPYRIKTQSGKSYYRVIVRMPDGKRKVVQAEKLKDVHEKKQALLDQIKQGLDVAAGKQTVSLYLEEFLTHVERTGEISLSTLADYRYHVCAHISPTVGHHELRSLTSKHVDDMEKSMVEKGLAAATVAYTVRVLRRALNFAVDWRYIDRNPASARSRSAKRRRPQKTKKQIAFLTTEQAQALQQGVGGHAEAGLILLALTSGMRPGEILGLHWRDVDFQSCRVTVHTALRRTKLRKGEHGDRVVLGSTKNDGSQRTIELSDITMAALGTHRERQREQRQIAGSKWQNRGLVFTTGHGSPLDISNVLHRFQAVCSELGLPRLRFYDLRHTHASLLIARGLHPKVIAERLGHASIKLTMDTYGHLFPAADREAANHIDAIFQRGAQSNEARTGEDEKVVEIPKRRTA